MCAMSPRLLRPRASGGFDPRSISGCICNLDASVLSSLRQNSDGTTAAAATDDPVGYWADLSGLGNHAKQTVATGSRPFLKLNNQNGRPGLLFDGSNDWMTATIAGFRSLTNVTIVQVIRPTAAAAADTNTAQFWGFGNISSGGGAFPQARALAMSSTTGTLSNETIAVAFESGSFGPRVGSSTYARPAATAQLFAATCGSSGTALRVNNAAVSLNLSNLMTTATATGPSNTGYSVDDDLHICASRGATTIAVTPEAVLYQMIVYDRVLTAAELTTIWNAMGRKWGIYPFAPPTYADADVNAYINAVEAADQAHLETGVRDAINTFITGCKADGIWSAIKASCILMGARTLSGALTPLVGTAPTNNNFVSGDYNRKTGLVGNGTTKYLSSGRANNADPQNNQSMGVYISAFGAGTNDAVIGAETGATAGASHIVIQKSPTSASDNFVLRSRGAQDVFDSVLQTHAVGLHGISRTDSGSFSYRLSGFSGTALKTSNSPSSGTINVFARDLGSALYATHRLAFYWIGESLTLSSLNSRVSTLYTAIGAAIP